MDKDSLGKMIAFSVLVIALVVAGGAVHYLNTDEYKVKHYTEQRDRYTEVLKEHLSEFADLSKFSYLKSCAYDADFQEICTYKHRDAHHFDSYDWTHTAYLTAEADDSFDKLEDQDKYMELCRLYDKMTEAARSVRKTYATGYYEKDYFDDFVEFSSLRYNVDFCTEAKITLRTSKHEYYVDKDCVFWSFKRDGKEVTPSWRDSRLSGSGSGTSGNSSGSGNSANGAAGTGGSSSSSKSSVSGSSGSSSSGSSHKSSSSGKSYVYHDSYDDGYDDVYLDEDYDEDRYRDDEDYARGVDDAMDDEDWDW